MMSGMKFGYWLIYPCYVDKIEYFLAELYEEPDANVL
jgi:hypothetical protein